MASTAGFGEVDEDGGPTVLAPVGSIDVATTPMLRERLQELLDQGERDVVVDLGAVEVLDSSGLGLLVAALRRYREAGGSLRLRSPSRHHRKLLDMTGLSAVFDVDA